MTVLEELEEQEALLSAGGPGETTRAVRLPLLDKAETLLS